MMGGEWPSVGSAGQGYAGGRPYTSCEKQSYSTSYLRVLLCRVNKYS